MAESIAQRTARVAFFLCLFLQLPVIPLYPLAEVEAEVGAGEAVERSAAPDFVSVLQVAIATAAAPIETQNPELLAVAFLPGALAHEAGNLILCETGIGSCTEGRLYNWTDWKTLGTQPEFAPTALRPRLVDTYPTKGRELVAGCLLSLAAGLLCLFTATKTALVGVGVCIYAVNGEGLKMAPWVGVFVSTALFTSGLFEVKANLEVKVGAAEQPEEKDNVAASFKKVEKAAKDNNAKKTK